jgi:hypothetical protein
MIDKNRFYSTVWERVHWNTIKNLVEGLGLKYVSEVRE